MDIVPSYSPVDGNQIGSREKCRNCTFLGSASRASQASPARRSEAALCVSVLVQHCLVHSTGNSQQRTFCPGLTFIEARAELLRFCAAFNELRRNAGWLASLSWMFPQVAAAGACDEMWTGSALCCAAPWVSSLILPEVVGAVCSLT